METLAAWSTFNTAFFTAALAATALCALKAAKETLDVSRRASIAAEQANQQAKLDSIERTRPYVLVEIIPSLSRLSRYAAGRQNYSQIFEFRSLRSQI